VPKLEELNGQQAAIDGVLARRGTPTKEVVIVVGSHGSGVTWTLERTATTWQSAGGASIVAKGEPFARERELFPWLMLTSPGAKRLARFEILKSGISHGSRAIPVVGQVTGFLIDELLNYRKRRIAREAVALTQQEQDLLFVIQASSQHKRLLLTIDNIEAWDRASWALLGLVLSNNLHQLYPAIAGALILVGANTETLSRLRPICSDIPITEYSIKSLNQNEFGVALSTFGIPITSGSEMNALYSVTNGRLDLAHDLGVHIRLSSSGDLASATDDFYDSLIDRRIISLEAKVPDLQKFLATVAILGERFSIEEIRCLTGYSQENLNAIVRLATDEHFISGLGDFLGFNSTALHQHFYREQSSEHCAYHGKLAECVRTIRAGDYEYRLHHLLLAQNAEEALTCYALAALSARRQQRPILDRTDVSNLSGWTDVREYLATMTAAYDAYENNSFDQALQILDKIEGFLPDVLIAERDYLESQIHLKTHGVRDYERAVELLGRWGELKRLEPEVWSRIGQVLVVGLVQIGRIDEARKLEADLEAYYWSRRKVDPWALYSLNVLRRKSECLHHLPTATIHLERALAYFGPLESQTPPRHPVQYYYALVNLVGNHIAGGHFDMAFQRALELETFVGDHPMIHWPGLENAANNSILAGFLSKNLSVSKANVLMAQLFESATGVGDRLLIQNNYAVFLIYADQLARAQELLQEAFSELTADDKPDEYHFYFVGNNLALLRAISGDISGAQDLFSKCGVGIDHLHVAIRQTLRRRHELLAHAIARGQELGKEKLDRYLLDRYPTQIGPQWSFYGRGFLLSDIQFWTAD
jgi:hypothetical protein